LAFGASDSRRHHAPDDDNRYNGGLCEQAEGQASLSISTTETASQKVQSCTSVSQRAQTLLDHSFTVDPLEA
jgi:hypothetical protein